MGPSRTAHALGVLELVAGPLAQVRLQQPWRGIRSNAVLVPRPCPQYLLSRRALSLGRPLRETASSHPESDSRADPDLLARLNPSPDSYNISPFKDRTEVTVYAGDGGHGCVSFLREKFIAEGPANGGDGGDGGSVMLQAVRGETSLHKLARQRLVRAGRGAHGRGQGRSGERGKDVLITVPVGTIVREVQRLDPREEEAFRGKGTGAGAAASTEDRWIRYPGMTTYEQKYLTAPKLPKPRASAAAALQPAAPIRLDLSEAMERPIMLAAGATGGLGNPHFVSNQHPRPKFATKGEGGMVLQLEFELKMLADVGLVGLPNAGKSTLLRALTNSQTRIGNWAFTTLQPTLGTVVLDNNKGRPALQAVDRRGRPRTSFTIADIPGLVKDAHLDKGLGLGFLRHVERAGVLAFVLDLSAGNAVEALQALWREVAAFEAAGARQLSAETETRMPEEVLEGTDQAQLPAQAPPISSKPWLVVATKADLDATEANFAQLKAYVESVRRGEAPHPSGQKNGWKKGVTALPVSAIRAEGVEQMTRHVVQLFE